MGTAEALLDAAEVAFADEGFDDASLRAIMRRAGTNPAAVHYHFGSREALAAAVLDRSLVPLNQRRVELLHQIEPPPSVEALVDALIRPDFELAADLQARAAGNHRLIGEIYLRPSRFVQSQVEARFAPVAARFAPLLAAAVPHVGPDELSWRVRWCLFPPLGAVIAEGDPTHLERLVAATAAALQAPEGDKP